MENKVLIRSLEFLERSGVKVASLVTDRHTQVQKFVREQKPDIAHFYDVWHLCKALTKKLDAISKKKDCSKFKMWQKSVKNHLYWSASGSSSGQETMAKWTSLLNHIQNVHVHENPLFPKCLHPPSSDKYKSTTYCSEMEALVQGWSEAGNKSQDNPVVLSQVSSASENKTFVA